MQIKNGSTVTYQDETYTVVHIYDSGYLEIGKENSFSRVILVHLSEVVFKDFEENINQ